MQVSLARLLPSLLSLYATFTQAQYDVAVVGAGLSGLSAARKLLDAGKSVIILEARNRVGGRVENYPLKNGGVTELGAAFVGPTQDDVLALADELGLKTFDEYNSGNNEAAIGKTISPYPALVGLPILDPVTDAELAAVIAKLDALALTINVNAPWDSPLAQQYDNMTFRDFLYKIITTKTGRAVIETASTAIWSAQSDQMSFLYVLAYIAGAGNETMPGTIDRLISTGGGAQESRIVGGTGLLPNGLADKLGRQHISFNTPVQSIAQQSSGQYLITDRNGKTFTASKVIVAMSPPLAGKIKYTPALPADRQALQQGMFVGSIGKANPVYATPFWRDSGLSGQAIGTTGAVRTTFDGSDANATYGLLIGFIEADEMKALDGASEAKIKKKALKNYVQFFGPQAKNVQEWVIQRWDLEEFSGGGPTSVAPKGVFQPYGPALKEPFNGIHWAGTEAAAYWPGYMSGAIGSGERAADEIISG